MKYIGQHIFDYVASFRQNVGIGTDSPSYPLEVVGNIFTKGHIFSVGDNFAIEIDGTDSGGPRMHIGFDHDTDGFITFGAYNNINNLDTKSRDFHLFGNNTTTGFYFDESAGKFGIGTVTPDQKLDVQGNIQISNTDASDGDTIGYLNFHNTTGGSSGNHARISAIRDSNSAGQLVFHTKIGGGDHERARISSEGFLGIGLTNPTEKLHVSGNAIITGNLTVSGTTTTINTANLNVEDKNITLNYSTGDSSSTADGAGITIQDAVDSSNDATILWDATNDEFDFSHGATFSGTVNFGVDGTGVDVKFFGDTSGRDMFWLQAQDALILKDNTELRIGSGYDLRLSHDGSHSRVKNYNGDLYITQRQDDGDIILQSDDGSGGTTEYFRLDGGVGYMIASKAIRALDSVNLQLGASADFTMQHNGTKTLLQNFTGNLEIIQNVDDGDIFFKSDDGSGGVATYMQIDGSHSRVIFPNNVKAAFGSSSRFVIFHDGTDAFMRETVGDLIIQQLADDKDIVFKCDDGSGGTTEYLRIDGSSEKTFYSKPILLFDSVALQLGTDTDATLYHSGGEGNLQNFTGNFRIIQGADNSDIQFFCDDGSGGVVEYMRIDGGDERTVFTKHTRHLDNAFFAVGTGGDFTIDHDGSNTSLQNSTGELRIRNYADDQDVVLQTDDGSGGITDYIRLDGSTTTTKFSKNTLHEDNVEARFGTDSDFQMFHSGSHGFITNSTGNLTIKNAADDKDIIFQCDDGSGGITTYFRLDGSAGVYTIWPDNSTAAWGSGADLRIAHDGTTASIFNTTGNLQIINYADDSDILFRSDDGSGGITTYLYLDGSNTITRAEKEIRFADNVKATFGNAADLDIYHDGTDSIIDNAVGNLTISNNADDGDILFQSDNGSGGVTNYLKIDGGNTNIQVSKNLYSFDNVKIAVGDSLDLQIYHNGSNSFISQNGNGHLYIENNTDDQDIIFRCDDGSGGTTNYFKLDGGDAIIKFEKDTRHFDSVRATFGNAGDLDVYHDSSNSYIENATGDLYIQNKADDKDIIFQSDDGSGGQTAYITLDGSQGFTTAQKTIRFDDSVGLQLGGSGDLQVFHNGTDSHIANYTGDLKIINYNDDKDIIFQSDDGSGGNATYLTLDGSAVTAVFEVDAYLNGSGNYIYSDISDNAFKFADNATLKIGTGNDLQLLHDGSNSHIVNYGGDLKITQNANDKDIIFNCDDGSGGNTAYITLDGSLTRTIANQHLQMADGKALYVGASSDAGFYHLSGHNYIENNTGDLNIVQNTDDGDIVFKSDNGSGGTTDYVRIDGANSVVTFSKDFKAGDNVKANFGAGSDLKIYHFGTGSIIENETGPLQIKQDANDEDIQFFADDGSGGMTEYFKLDGSIERNVFSKDVNFGDGISARFNGDLRLRSTGGNQYITSQGSNDLYIQQTTDDKDIIFQSDNGSGGVIEYLRLDGSHERLTVNSPNGVVFFDNIKANFGTDSDLQIYHDGSNSYIDETGTGVLVIGSSQTNFQVGGANKMIIGTNDITILDNIGLDVGTGGDFQIKHDGSNTLVENITGHLYFYQKADDSDISFFCDDGSGGNTEYFRIDGGGGFMVGSKSLYMLDDNRLYIGSAGDMELNHNGTNSFIYNHTGNLTIQNNTDDGDIIFRGDDGSGGTTIYFRVDGSIVHTSFLKPTLHNDNVKASFGDAPDLHIYHDGTNSYIQNETGQLYILNKADNKDIEFQSDDGNGGLATYFKLDGSLAAHDGSSFTALYTAFPDNSLAAFGDSQDLVMYHSGSHSLIRHLGTGNLYIDNTTDDAKIFFRNDDGSGGLTTYIEIQGDNTRTVFRKDLNLQDTVNLYLGTSSDLRLIHDGADSAISNATGNLVITNEADDKDIIFKCDDGSGGLTEYLRLDGGFSSPQIKIPDNVQMNFGAGLDLRIIHDGFDSYISSNGTGHLYIRQLNDDKDIIFQSDNGSGGLTNYLKIDGDNTNIQVSKNLYAFDNVKIAVGDSLDLQIYHNGSNSFISQNGNGHLYIENNTDDQDIIFRCDDGSGGVTTYFQLDGSSATNIFSKDVLLTDSISLKIGSAADLKIYHDGSHSYIKDNGTGNLRIDATNLHFRNADGSKLYASGIDGGAFSLRHNNVTKLATSADGVDITGNLTVSTSSTSSGIYAQFINLKGFCTLAANYQFAEDLEDTKSPFEMALDYGSATISSSTEINQSNLFRASGFHVPVACSVNAINMQLTCNNTGNVTIAVVEYRPSEAGTDQVDHPRTIYEEVVVASNNNNNKVKTVTVATADLDNTAIPAGSHIMIMAKGDSDSVGGKAFISAAIEIKW